MMRERNTEWRFIAQPETHLRWVNCERCGGSGEIIRRETSFLWHVEPYEYGEICNACEGTGRDCAMVASDDETAIQRLDRLYPTRYGDDLVGLGQFILNLTRHPGDPETDAENIAIAVLSAVAPETSP